jgi:hypothetical protein
MTEEFNPCAPPSSSVEFVPEGGAWRDGEVVVLDRKGLLPPRCVKCNEPAEEPVRTSKVYWHHPAIYLMVLLNILILLPACRSAPSDPATDALLKKTAGDFNLVASGEPADKERKLLSTTPGPGRTLTFHYRIRKFSSADVKTDPLQRYAESLRGELPGKINRTELFQDLSRNRVALVYEYAGADGARLFEIRMEPEPGKGYRLK